MFPGVHAQTTPDKPAVVLAGSGRTITYRELDENSARLARALHDLGLRPGDVLAMLSDNAPECFEIYWAALRSGLYITAVNSHLTAAEVAYIIDDSDAKAVIASSGVADLARGVRTLAPRVEHWLAFGGPVAGYDPYTEALAGAGERLTEQPRGIDMLYSSGTTGRPKGIKPPLPTFAVDQPGDPLTAVVGKLFSLGPDDVYLSPAPIYHAAPLRWCGVIHAYGGTVVLLEKFTATDALEAIERFGATITQMVPTMFVRMLQLPEHTRAGYDVSSLRLVVHAAAPCPPEVKRAVIAWWGPIVAEYYGSTEGNGLSVITTQEWEAKPGSVGRSMLGPVHICDDEGAELPSGEVGTVYFERETLPFAYHKDPEKTATAQHPDHPTWTAVGDLGYVDADGYLFLTDRKSFVIISGGVNIYPQEIENLLALHPAIFDVAVIGVPDPEMGQQVKAVVQLRPEVAATEELATEIIDHVRDRIAHYKAPKSVDFVDRLPRTATGKLVKRELEQRYVPAR
ncbi:acyl-CoA synthetase [Nocardia bovistercoris]|uniref:Acyl-CoA synthetase n=1 Tax=Nocardia bovistercoris TaxID=2785916 RepID=A0A931I9U1_9NOCA|nr:acyl-CoA synthetase [Nocardia bovistercoris]MBH0776701.1 acyl-CoA synthetase [Nocardia bovistercoris]